MAPPIVSHQSFLTRQAKII